MVMSPAQLDKLGDEFGTNPVCVGTAPREEVNSLDR